MILILTNSVSILRVSGVIIHFYFIFGKKILYANIEDPDQTPRFAASDLGLHCLPLSQNWNARLIWVKDKKTY